MKDDDWPIVNEGTHEGEPSVDLYLEDDDEESILGEEIAHELELGESYCVGIKTITHGIDANNEAALLDALDDEITLAADMECPDLGDPPECVEPNEETWDKIGDEDEFGGPVILMGLDSEQGAGSGGHSSVEDHASMVESLLEDVVNGGEGTLALGGSEDETNNVQPYWEENIGENVEEEVTFVDSDDIETHSFDGYAMIGIASSTHLINTGPFQPDEGLTNEENGMVADRSGYIATFVNNGGGFLGKT